MSKRFSTYSDNESLAEMKARFPAALETVMLDGDDERCLDDRHIFDFEGNWRMHVTRDRMENGREIILISFADANSAFYPVELLTAKAAVLFAELTENKYGNPEIANIEPPIVQLFYRL